MTSDEFHRILVAMCAMQSYNIGGEPYVSFVRAMAIVHSQLHPDDQSKWRFDPQRMAWQHLTEADGEEKGS